MKTNEDKKYLLIALLCGLVYVLPGIFLYTLVGMYETQRKDLPGLTRLQPGQAIIVDENALASNPLYRPILVAEKLNRELSIRAIFSPTMAARIKGSTLPELESVVVEDPEEENPEELRDLLEAASNYGLKWDPTASPWGIFLGPGEIAPPDGLPFGAVTFANGAEKTRYDTETRLNSLLIKMREDGLMSKEGLSSSGNPLVDVLTTASQYGEIEKTEISPLIAASETLNIEYRPEQDLFLSTQTLLAMKPWLLKSSKVSPVKKSVEINP